MTDINNTIKLPKTINRSQLAYALGYGRNGGGVNWKSFYTYLETAIGEDWEEKLMLYPRQRVFNAIQTQKIIKSLELTAEHFNSRK